ncbi:hypothetical protein V6N13_071282 [Hibiscus sabdariffa]
MNLIKQASLALYQDTYRPLMSESEWPYAGSAEIAEAMAFGSMSFKLVLPEILEQNQGRDGNKGNRKESGKLELQNKLKSQPAFDITT